MVPTRVLYLSATGALEPLGYSQVVRVVVPLAQRGHRLRLVSLERAQDLADVERLRRVSTELSAAGIEWSHLPYATGRGAAADNQRRLTEAALARTLGGRTDLVHCRGYLAAGAALTTKALTRTPYLFDTRAYWFDEQRESGRRLQSNVAYGAAKVLERRLFAHSSGAVTLTQLAADDLRSGLFGPWPADKPAQAITTVADYQAFAAHPPLPERDRAALAGRLVLGYVGSVNFWYEVTATIRLFQKVRALRPDALFLALCRQEDELQKLLNEQQVNSGDALITRASNDQMPAWLGAIDWGFLLLRKCFAKRASMPTKLAEFFAAGVRPIAHGCNSEVDEWVRRAGTGVTVPDLTEHSLDAAAVEIAQTPSSPQLLSEGRERTRSHFGLDSAISAYDELYRRLGNRSGFT